MAIFTKRRDALLTLDIKIKQDVMQVCGKLPCTMESVGRYITVAACMDPIIIDFIMCYSYSPVQIK